MGSRIIGTQNKNGEKWIMISTHWALIIHVIS